MTPDMTLHVGTTSYGCEGMSADQIFRLGIEKAHGCQPDFRAALFADPRPQPNCSNPEGHHWHKTEIEDQWACDYCSAVMNR